MQSSLKLSLVHSKTWMARLNYSCICLKIFALALSEHTVQLFQKLIHDHKMTKLSTLVLIKDWENNDLYTTSILEHYKLFYSKELLQHKISYPQGHTCFKDIWNLVTGWRQLTPQRFFKKEQYVKIRRWAQHALDMLW